MSQSWSCPYCERVATIREHDCTVGHDDLFIQNSDGFRRLHWFFIVCPNPSCNKFTLTVRIEKLNDNGIPYGGTLKIWNLIPPSEAKTFPSYIPEAITNDYEEACLIVDLSPKASATLSRRCLQGIIRDFWGVSERTLYEEINKIKDKVEKEVWDAIEAVKNVGNIGAHMEKDINVIVDVEPNEAKLLIGLIELLLKEWYIAREERKKRLEEIKKLGKKKEKEKNGGSEKS